jgi:hypothetical protein
VVSDIGIVASASNYSSISLVASAAARASEFSDSWFSEVGTEGGCSVDGEATTPAGGTKLSPSSVSSCMRNVSQISMS